MAESKRKKTNADYKQFRTPRLYKEASNILKEVETNKVGIKNSVFNSKHRKKTTLVNLLCGVLKHRSELEYVIAATKLDVVPNVNPFLLKVIIYEYLFKEKLASSNAKTVLVVRENVKPLEKALEGYYADEGIKKPSVKNEINIPRYARVNLLKTTLDEVLLALKADNFLKIDYNPQISYKDFIHLVENLQYSEFVCDLHVENLLIFHPNTVFFDHQLYQCGKLLLQDKASLLPSIVLNPPPDSFVLDACAAPGMKTSHLAAIMKNTGEILAMDLSATRSAVMADILKEANVKNTRIKVADFSKVDVSAKPYSLVQYILLDPSCSGSGIVARAVMLDEDPKKVTTERNSRLGPLAKFQEVMLRKALSFPNVQRVVYSTCSINSWENEQVVSRLMREFRRKFQLARPNLQGDAPFLNGKQDDFPELRDKCIRMVSKRDLTNGFFVALFERIIDDGTKPENSVENSEKSERKKEKKRRKSKTLDSDLETENGNRESLRDVTEVEIKNENESAKKIHNVAKPCSFESKSPKMRGKEKKKKRTDGDISNSEDGINYSNVVSVEDSSRIPNEEMNLENSAENLEKVERKKGEKKRRKSKKLDTGRETENGNRECLRDVIEVEIENENESTSEICNAANPCSSASKSRKMQGKEKKKKRTDGDISTSALVLDKYDSEDGNDSKNVVSVEDSSRILNEGTELENGAENLEKVERKKGEKKRRKSKKLDTSRETENGNPESLRDLIEVEIESENESTSEICNAAEPCSSASKSRKMRGKGKKKKRRMDDDISTSALVLDKCNSEDGNNNSKNVVSVEDSSRIPSEGMNLENGAENLEKVERKKGEKKRRKSKKLDTSPVTENEDREGLRDVIEVEIKSENEAANEICSVSKPFSSSSSSRSSKSSKSGKKRRRDGDSSNSSVLKNCNSEDENTKSNNDSFEDHREICGNLEQDDFVDEKKAVKRKKLKDGAKKRKSHAEMPLDGNKALEDEVEISPKQQSRSCNDSSRSSKKKRRRKSLEATEV